MKQEEIKTVARPRMRPETPIKEFVCYAQGRGIHQLHCILAFAEDHGLTTLGQFAEARRDSLLLVKGFGRASFRRLEGVLDELGFISHPTITDIAKIPIKSLQASTRLVNVLSNANIQTVGDLAKMSIRDLCRVKGLGWRGIREARDLITRNGLSLIPD